MTTANIFTEENSFRNDINDAKTLVYDKCGFDFTVLKLNSESIEYGACSFKLNGKTIQHRSSKTTPIKKGQFVTIWKRNQEGKTAPFDISDDIDFVIITSKSDDKFGQFVFPKCVLVDKGIISKNGKEGKLGIRVYPPWDIVTNKQAVKTQSWQTKYFVVIGNENSSDLYLIKKLILESNF